MKPHERARMLVNEFSKIIGGDYTSMLPTYRLCAIMSATEAYLEASRNNDLTRTSYWLEVKKEIEHTL